jgi:hypothetical protein
VTVRTRLPESATASATINADLEIQFAGTTAQYKQIPFKVETKGGVTHIPGTIPATVADFKIDPPSLLTMPVKNDIPVRVDMTWASAINTGNLAQSQSGFESPSIKNPPVRSAVMHSLRW